MKRIRKAIAGVITPIVAFAVGWLVLKTGLNIDQDTVIVIDGLISSALTGLVVHQVPNEA